MSRRRLSDDEHALWSDVTRAIAPLRLRPPRPVAAPVKPDSTRPHAASKRPKPRSLPPVAAPVSAPPVAPLAPLGRRFKHEVVRGRRAIDGRLDLHGMTQAEAHSALLGYLGRAQARGDRLVLVITGKGARAGGDARERGVLRRQVPRWLGLPEFRAHIIGFDAAHIGHGGEGALYVQLRRVR